MNVIIFVIDGLGMWSNEQVSTYQLLENYFGIDPIVKFPTLCELGFIKAKKGEGNILMQKSVGVGSLEGHREMFGHVSIDKYSILEDGIPDEILQKASSEYGISCLGNIQGRGKQIINQYWAKHKETKLPILYSGLDSTVSIAFEKDTLDIHRVYNFAKTLMLYLRCQGLSIRKFIIREFLNTPDNKLSEKELFYPIDFNEKIGSLGFKNIIINNKIQDIFNFNNATIVESHNDDECFSHFFASYPQMEDGIFFLNLGDFDYNAHRGCIDGCLKTLEKIDFQLSKVRQQLKSCDFLIIASDHGVKYEETNLSYTHLREGTLFLVSTNDKIFFRPGIVSGHEALYKTLYAISKNIELSNLGFVLNGV